MRKYGYYVSDGYIGTLVNGDIRKFPTENEYNEYCDDIEEEILSININLDTQIKGGDFIRRITGYQ